MTITSPTHSRRTRASSHAPDNSPATPLAIGLKAVEVPYPAALQSLKAFFGSLWTDANTAQVERRYYIAAPS
jgi:hypothetical protein